MKRRWHTFSHLARLVFARPTVEILEEHSAPTDLVLASVGTLALAEGVLRAEPYRAIAPAHQSATNAPPPLI